MTGKEIVKEILCLRKWSQSKLAEEMGKSQTNITGYLNRGKNEMRLDVFVEMIESMGCEVVVQDKMGSSEKWKVKYEKLDNTKTNLNNSTTTLPKEHTSGKTKIKLTPGTREELLEKINNPKPKIDLDALLSDDEPEPPKKSKKIKLI